MEKRTSFSFFSMLTAIVGIVMLFFIGCDFSVDPGTCIPSGDDQDIQNALTDEGSKAVLCKNAVFELHNTILYTADNQEIYTQGYPTDDTRAILNVADKAIATAVSVESQSNAKLQNVIINGNRPEYGSGAGALIEWSGLGSGNLVEYVKAYEPRGWSILYMGEGDDLACRNATARYNELGPGGRAEYGMADGISLACPNSTVENNTIVDVTDGGIVIFQAPGSRIANNTITAENRIMFYGISMEDFGPWAGDFTGTVVTGNTIDAKSAIIRKGIAMGPHIGCILSPGEEIRSYGASVTNNTLTGDYMGYGFVMSGVENWTATGNIDLSTHLVPLYDADCFGEVVDAPGGFQMNAATSEGTFQDEFEDSILGFTTTWWPAQAVASESCLADLIGSQLLNDIKDGKKGLIWEALEEAPNGELIEQCISIYNPPDVQDDSGEVIPSIEACEPTCVTVSFMNPSETETVDMRNAEFLMESFVVSCDGLPDFIEPGEEGQCTVEDFVAEGFIILLWYGFPVIDNNHGWGFNYPIEEG